VLQTPGGTESPVRHIAAITEAALAAASQARLYARISSPYLTGSSKTCSKMRWTRWKEGAHYHAITDGEKEY